MPELPSFTMAFDITAFTSYVLGFLRSWWVALPLVLGVGLAAFAFIAHSVLSATREAAGSVIIGGVEISGEELSAIKRREVLSAVRRQVSRGISPDDLADV